MLIGYFEYQNKLFLSIKRTDWSHTQFTYRPMIDNERKVKAVNGFFENSCD